MGSNRRIFQNLSAQDPSHNSDHFIVMGCLHGEFPREHSCYIRRRMRLPLQLPGHQTRTWTEHIFAELRHAVPNLDKRVARHNSWILEETWRLIDKRVSARWEPGRDQRRLRWLGRAMREALKENMRQRALTVGEDV